MTNNNNKQVGPTNTHPLKNHKPQEKKELNYFLEENLKVILTMKTIIKLRVLFNINTENEAMAMGYLSFNKDKSIVTIEDIFVPKQEVSGGSCSIVEPENGGNLSEFYYDIAFEKEQTTDTGRAWIHIHPNGIGITPSTTDIHQQYEFLHEMNMPFMFMLIFTEQFPFGQYTCKLSYRSQNFFGNEVMTVDIPLSADVNDNAQDIDVDQLKKEYENMITTENNYFLPGKKPLSKIHNPHHYYNNKDLYDDDDEWWDKTYGLNTNRNGNVAPIENVVDEDIYEFDNDALDPKSPFYYK